MALSAVVTWGPPGARAGAGLQLPRVEPDVPVTGSDERLQLGHNSPVLLADPTDGRFVALASRLDNPDFGCALQLSGDGGRSWLPVRPVPQLPAGADKCYAPEIGFGPDGVLYYLFIALQGQGNSPSGSYLVTSTDRGRTFGEPRQVLGPERYMVRMAIDRSMGPMGRLYLAWLQASSDPPLGGLPQPPNPIFSAYSDDGGATFSTPVQVSDPGRERVVAPALALGPSGTVHVLYYDLKDDFRDYQGLEGPTWEGTWSLVLATSTDGGRSFGQQAAVDDGIVPPERVMLIYTMPPAALAVDGDRVYASWTDARASGWDVLLRRSGDGGRTWDGPQRLNDDPPASVARQYMPRLSVAPGGLSGRERGPGRLDAIYYDRRNDPAGVMNDVSFTSSSDAGRTFSPNVRLNHESFNSQVGTRYPIPSATRLVEFGSRIALVARPHSALAAWTDTRNQEAESYGQDIFATEITLTGAAGADGAAPGDDGDGVSAGWLVVAAAAVVGLALGFALWRTARRRGSPAGGEEQPGVTPPGTPRSSP